MKKDEWISAAAAALRPHMQDSEEDAVAYAQDLYITYVEKPWFPGGCWEVDPIGAVNEDLEYWD